MRPGRHRPLRPRAARPAGGAASPLPIDSAPPSRSPSTARFVSDRWRPAITLARHVCAVCRLRAGASGQGGLGGARRRADRRQERRAACRRRPARRPHRRAPGGEPAAISTPRRPAGWRPGPSIGSGSPRLGSQGMADGLRDVAALPDPIGEILDGWTRPNGLRIERRRVPLGVVAIIYENRPNVTSDAAGICLKSGNVALLRGSASRAAVQRGHRRDAPRRRDQGRACRPTACCWSTTSATRPRSSSCSSPASSTA